MHSEDKKKPTSVQMVGYSREEECLKKTVYTSLIIFAVILSSCFSIAVQIYRVYMH